MRKIDLLKKTVSAFCAGCLVILSFPMSFRAASATATTTDYLNLREGAGTNTRVILTLPKNTTVSILDNSDAQWAKVKTSSGKTGYCFKQYLSFSSSSGQTSSGTNLTATTTANLNLRQEASLRGKILRVMPKGTAVTVLDNSNSGWVKVQTSSGTQGWCSRQYLTISGSSASAGSNSAAGSITARTTAYLHLRTGPGLSNPVILTMSKGLAVTVLDNSNPDWVRVCTPSGTLGWCSRQYLTISDSSSSTESNSTASSMTARTTDYLNLRTGPGLSNRVILTMSKGLTVTVLDHSNSDWFKVRTPSGTQGWCSRRYLTITQSADTADTNQSASSSPSSMPSSSSASSESTENSDDSEEEDSDSGLAGITGATVTADVFTPARTAKHIEHYLDQFGVWNETASAECARFRLGKGPNFRRQNRLCEHRLCHIPEFRRYFNGWKFRHRNHGCHAFPVIRSTNRAYRKNFVLKGNNQSEQCRCQLDKQRYIRCNGCKRICNRRCKRQCGDYRKIRIGNSSLQRNGSGRGNRFAQPMLRRISRGRESKSRLLPLRIPAATECVFM
jgi:uncharacterized protein YgiM (DUF1202 family)